MRRGAVLASLALVPLAAAACGVIGGSTELTAAQKFIAEAKIGPADPKLAELALVGWVDHKNRSYDPGDKITVSLWVDKDAYVAVLRVRRNGEATLLFPNKDQPNALVSANTTVQLPGPGDSYEIVAGKDSPELIEFIASVNGNSWLFKRPSSGDASFAELGATTRSLAKEIAASLAGRGSTDNSRASQRLVIAID